MLLSKRYILESSRRDSFSWASPAERTGHVQDHSSVTAPIKHNSRDLAQPCYLKHQRPYTCLPCALLLLSCNNKHICLGYISQLSSGFSKHRGWVPFRFTKEESRSPSGCQGCDSSAVSQVSGAIWTPIDCRSSRRSYCSSSITRYNHTFKYKAIQRTILETTAW